METFEFIFGKSFFLEDTGNTEFRDNEIGRDSELDSAKDRDEDEKARFATEQDFFWGIK